MPAEIGRPSCDNRVLATAAELLDEVGRALDRLRAAHGGATWRETVIESTSDLSHAVAGLLNTLRQPPPGNLTESHLRAQRLARVKVAEMQLYSSAQVKAGQTARDLYSALKPQIEGARSVFAEQFLTPSNGIPDYLHQEIVRVLAYHDEALLGPHYPGPMA